MSGRARTGFRGLGRAVAALSALTIAGCGATPTAPTAGATGATPSTVSTAPAPASQPGPSAKVTQCNGTDIGLTLPTVPATVALPQGVTVPPGDEVYGADIRMAWDKESGDQTDRHGTLYVIGHPGATSVGCYQTSNNPSGLNEVLIQPDNGIYSEGAMIVPPGDRGNCNPLTALECGDIEDSASRTAVPTGTPSVTVTALVVQGPLPAKGYLQGSLPADDSKPVVELIVENRNSDRGGTSSGFSGVIACSLDSAADCSATLPYFLTQASLGSPMTSADYTQAFTKISAVIHSLN